jgi:hypothetical protein
MMFSQCARREYLSRGQGGGVGTPSRLSPLAPSLVSRCETSENMRLSNLVGYSTSRTRNNEHQQGNNPCFHAGNWSAPGLSRCSTLLNDAVSVTATPLKSRGWPARMDLFTLHPLLKTDILDLSAHITAFSQAFLSFNHCWTDALLHSFIHSFDSENKTFTSHRYQRLELSNLWFLIFPDRQTLESIPTSIQA